jgi:hypothetical protein
VLFVRCDLDRQKEWTVWFSRGSIVDQSRYGPVSFTPVVDLDHTNDRSDFQLFLVQTQENRIEK